MQALDRPGSRASIYSSATRSEGAGGVTVSMSSQGPHRCGLCNKVFERRDLRDRHKRRCIHSFARPRKSKRKSCVSCAASKLSCDLAIPSCSRCSNRQVICEYVTKATTASKEITMGVQSSPQPSSGSEAEVQEQKSSNRIRVAHRKPSNAFDRQLCEMTSIGKEGNLAADQRQRQRQNWNNPLLDGDRSTSPFADPIGTFTINSYQRDLQTVQIDDRSLPSSRDESLYLSRGLERNQNGDHELAISEPRLDAESLLDWDGPHNSSALSTSRADFLPSEYPIAWVDSTNTGIDQTEQQDWSLDILDYPILDTAGNFTFDLLGSFGIPGSRTSTNQSGIDDDSLAFSTVSWKPPLPFPTQNTASIFSLKDPGAAPTPSSITSSIATTSHIDRPLLLDPANSSGLLKYNPILVPGGYELSSNSPNLPTRKTDTDDDKIKILSEYPQLMLRRGTYPPFVHHKLYRCEEGDVIKSLAHAFCCVSAFNAAMPSSQGLVQSLMNAERDKLVKAFPLTSDSGLESLAAVHAMCVYQITGFFVGLNSDSARSAELQQPFFLKMTRRLIASHLPLLVEPSTPVKPLDQSWRQWIFSETIRRTIFLVQIINCLSCRAQKQNPYFYENLSDDLVQSLPLPAPDPIWKASSAEEWAMAWKREVEEGWNVGATSKMALEALGDERQTMLSGFNHNVGDVCNNDIQNSRTATSGASRLDPKSLQAYTQLIIACTG